MPGEMGLFGDQNTSILTFLERHVGRLSCFRIGKADGGVDQTVNLHPHLYDFQLDF
jgi:hypothetical protein